MSNRGKGFDRGKGIVSRRRSILGSWQGRQSWGWWAEVARNSKIGQFLPSFCLLNFEASCLRPAR